MSDNLFRRKYRALTEEETQLLSDIKAKADELNQLIPSVADERARSFALARTNLQQAVMWAVHGITG